MKFLTSALLVAFGAAHVAADCENPVFTASATWGDASIAITLAPEQQKIPDDSKICVAYRGQDSCCSAATLTAVDNAVTTTHKAIEQTKTVIKDLDVKKDFQTNLIDIACSAVFILDSEKKKKCTDITNTGVNKMEDKVKQLANDALNCADSMLGYEAGMLCFACSNDWSNYVDTEKQVIKIAKATCNGIAASCTPMMNDSRDVILIFADMIKQLLELGLNASIDITGSLPDFCGGTTSNPGDCAKIVCDEWLSGLHYNIQTKFGSSRRMLASSDMSAVHPEMVDLLSHILGTVEHVLEPLAAVNPSGMHFDGHRVLAASGKNEYTDDGYDSYAVGCQESSTNCPNLYFWWWVAAAVASVGVIAVLAFVVMKKRSTARGGFGASLSSRA